MPLFYRGIPAGVITLSWENGRMSLAAECPRTADGIFRAYACSSRVHDMRLLVGVMEPLGEVLQARRVYTRNDLSRNGASPEAIDTGELVRSACVHGDLGGLGWKKAADPERLFSDAALRTSLRGAEGVLVDSYDAPTRVAVPFHSDAPFPLAPAFCLVRIAYIDGARCGILSRGEAGEPIFFHGLT